MYLVGEEAPSGLLAAVLPAAGASGGHCSIPDTAPDFLLAAGASAAAAPAANAAPAPEALLGRGLNMRLGLMLRRILVKPPAAASLNRACCAFLTGSVGLGADRVGPSSSPGSRPCRSWTPERAPEDTVQDSHILLHVTSLDFCCCITDESLCQCMLMASTAKGWHSSSNCPNSAGCVARRY
jgi:hypothetical protein